VVSRGAVWGRGSVVPASEALVMRRGEDARKGSVVETRGQLEHQGSRQRTTEEGNKHRELCMLQVAAMQLSTMRVRCGGMALGVSTLPRRPGPL
jgi:hypothetical protein